MEEITEHVLTDLKDDYFDAADYRYCGWDAYEPDQLMADEWPYEYLITKKLRLWTQY